MPGAELLGLEHRGGLRRDLGQMRPDLVRAVPDHHHRALRRERLGRTERVTEQCPAEQWVQHLGQRGLHPLALTGGKYDDGAGVGLGHDVAPVGTRTLSRGHANQTIRPG
ncbi:hypothetical protein GCM10011608_07860 [Micromonospora sonchi]|uniref:Uncharacterized protein n=1 Tax=Micromonospora sonchi TaxID=1763543 RepID=A0A917WRI9_9ACTN|nr:hypothetical protein GCM10011608_07860 [Micromonospora sonchi]